MPIPVAQVQQLLTWLAVTAALLYWIRSWRRSRTPGLLAMVKALAALNVALILGTDWGVHDWLFGIPTLPNYIVHVLTLSSAYWLQVFVLYLAHPVDTIPAKVRIRTRLLIGAQLALCVLYLLGPLPGNLPAITAEAGNHTFVVAYLAVFELYLGLAMFDVVYVGRHAKDLPRGYLRTGLRLLRWGGICGLAFVAHKALYSLAVRFNLNPPWAELGNIGASRVLTTAGILLLMAGVTVPAVVPRRQLRRHYRALEPLWRDLTTFAPELRYDAPPTRRVFGRPDVTDLVRTRLTEINDVLVGPLQPYLDPAVYTAALQPAEAGTSSANRAHAQAVTIATALVTAEHGAPVHAEHPVAFTPDEATDDYREEAAWLATVATAYSTSTTVAEILKETSSHAADPVH
ncbi:hypothetical protein SAMN04489729_0817 [Amycolatopsis lurida]|uniref:DUF6545 domain-containing protein n=1 Tax=Amycolatopsis lurida NRRL 2430 TaxID=1460371 RepID=A0A2P2FM46_AMYLU|nr:MAB_1171c family putative transporter [Amycolatopsis lurida]KFU77790.1 hypothetical protein BB31_29430 [Amycolatopsis lurida NRRL 2430]SEB38874.1 hypothetical protein SAMN04489729_0817 [Amycolatopsis lurida]